MLIANFSFVPKSDKFTLDVYDYNASMSYTLHYHITGKQLSVVRLNGLKGEQSKVLFKKVLPKKAFDQLFSFLRSPALKNLKGCYKNPLIEDGDHKRFIWMISGSKKVIEVSNTYVPELAKLISIVNQNLTYDLKIDYYFK